MAGHHPPAGPLGVAEQRRDRVAAVQLHRLALGRGQVGGQLGELAQGAGGQRGRHPLAVLVVGDAAVGERLAEHGHDSFTVGVGGAKIARRWARGHDLKIPAFPARLRALASPCSPVAAVLPSRPGARQIRRPEDGLRRFGDDGQRCGHVLEGLALGVNREEDRGQAAEDHRDRADEVADEQRVAVLPGADQVTVPGRAEGAEALRDGEEHRDRLRPDLKREDLAGGQVAGAGARRGEEEDDRPAQRQRGRVQGAVLEQEGDDHQQDPGQQVGARDHLPAADRVEQPADRQRAEQVARREREEVVGGVESALTWKKYSSTSP